jgi:hypothetical protein
MSNFPNTAQKGFVRYIVFKEEGEWHAVGLEFNIVISADTAEIALFELFDAMQGYVESFRKLRGVRPHALNQKADPEYEVLWKKLKQAKQPIKSPYSIYTFGEKALAA